MTKDSINLVLNTLNQKSTLPLFIIKYKGLCVDIYALIPGDTQATWIGWAKGHFGRVETLVISTQYQATNKIAPLFNMDIQALKNYLALMLNCPIYFREKI